MGTAWNGTSFVEQTLFYYVEKFFPAAKSRYKTVCAGKKLEVDIYIPPYRLAIEYDGSYWHKSKTDRDIQKNEMLNSANIYVIRVREYGLPILPNFWGKSILLKKRELNEDANFDYIELTIKEVCQFVLQEYHVRLPFSSFQLSQERYLKDLPYIYGLVLNKEIRPSLAEYCGAQYWDYKLSSPLRPEFIPRDGWAYAFLTCPNGNKLVLPRYHREYTDKCEIDGDDCANCNFYLFCPFLVTCIGQSNTKHVHCEYMNNKVLEAIRNGDSYLWHVGWVTMEHWLFEMSDCGNSVFKEFFESSSRDFREKIINFFGYKRRNETILRAFDEESYGLFKSFAYQVPDARITIIKKF